jgi:hypothetical protein
VQTENPDAEPVPRIRISYWCNNGHETTPVFAQLPHVQIPDRWDCIRCGMPASRTPGSGMAQPPGEPFKSHLEYVKERRTNAEAEQLLHNALVKLRHSHLMD